MITPTEYVRDCLAPNAVCPLMAEALTRDYMRDLVEVPA